MKETYLYLYLAFMFTLFTALIVGEVIFFMNITKSIFGALLSLPIMLMLILIAQFFIIRIPEKYNWFEEDERQRI